MVTFIFPGQRVKMKAFNLKDWKRREHFEFFSQFADPYFSVDTQLDVGPLLRYTQAHQLPLFISYFYLSLRAANQIQAFKLRTQQHSVVECDVINGSTTFINHQHCFGFCHLDYQADFAQFCPSAKNRLDQSRQKTENLLAEDPRIDVIYYSVLPWIHFNSFKHPNFGQADASIPKFMFGKINREDPRPTLPFSVNVNHALMDGYHVGLLFETFQEMLLAPETYLQP